MRPGRFFSTPSPETWSACCRVPAGAPRRRERAGMNEAGETWAPPPPPIQLAEDEIHIWSAWLDRPGQPADRVAATPSAGERTRADRPRIDKGTRRVNSGRAILRGILAR